jgi:hypothetical protein
LASVTRINRPAARRYFLHIGSGLVEYAVVGGDHDDRHGLVDEHNLAVG